ncbi:hypothetical protein HBI25_206550 [Parastagonospora nodorum]|nr:hypothetical protein HBI76_190340 [Parastagonospora nodorum]KAH5145295.1 hypothetical protein HBH69_185830 [Parastagonospora nodorum]KAH5444683.1 hypothetical protein HBI30_207250 [Parastagonospora nodorum]KAH5547915.1 hypothetical protein HBI25_206550 [Parastagonospora nodorum]KAH5643333.1 hypothetical protein HBI23_195360 [Parastagonospora nodorum]
MSGSGSDSLTEELRAKITRLAAEATTKLATEGLAEQVDILTASNIEYAAFLEEWKKQPGGSQHGSQLPSVRDTTLSAPVHHRLPSAPLPHRQEAFTEDALQLHIALPNRKFDTSFEPDPAPALAPEETLCATPAPARKAPLKAAPKPTPKPASKPVAKKTPVTKKKELSTEFVDPLSDDDTAMEITVEEDEGDDVKVEEVSDGEEEGAEAEEQSEPKDEDATYVDEELPVPAPSRIVSLRTGSSKYTARCHSAANE